MLRWAKAGRLFCRVYGRAGVVLHGRPLLTPCIHSFAGPSASTASRYEDQALTGCHVNLSASGARRIHGSASGKEPAPSSSSAAKLSVLNASRQDADANLSTKALEWSLCDDKSHNVDGDAQISVSATCLPSNVDVTGAETAASSCATQPLHALVQTLLSQTDKVPADLQQIVELLELEQFSLSEVRCLLKARAFRSCSVQDLATMIKELKKCVPSAKLAHGIVVQCPNVLLQSAKLVQQKLKLLHDFQVEEKVIGKICVRGGVLSLGMESLQKKLKFYEDFGLTAAARNMMLWRAPLTLSLSIEKSVLPLLEVLEKMGLSKETIFKVAQYSPNIFNFSHDKLVKKCEFLKRLGFSDNRLYRAFCLIDRSSIENIEVHMHALRDLGFADEDVKSMIQRQPEILGHSSESLKSKVDFLISEQHRNHKEIVRFPPYLLYSLQARIIPRFRVYNESAHSTVYALSSILSCSDSKFSKLFGKAED